MFFWYFTQKQPQSSLPSILQMFTCSLNTSNPNYEGPDNGLNEGSTKCIDREKHTIQRKNLLWPDLTVSAVIYFLHIYYMAVNSSCNLATRKDEVCTIRSKFPNKVPVRSFPAFVLKFWTIWATRILTDFCVLKVIVERCSREKRLPLLDKTKFLVPHELTIGQFLCLLRWVISELKFADYKTKGKVYKTMRTGCMSQVAVMHAEYIAPICFLSVLHLLSTDTSLHLYQFLYSHHSLISMLVFYGNCWKSRM